MASARNKTGAAPRTGAGRIVDSKAEAIAELMLEVAQCFFRIRAVGRKTGLITSWGGGAFGPWFVGRIAEHGSKPTKIENMSDAIGWGGGLYLIGAALLIGAVFVARRSALSSPPVAGLNV